jgi:hypothetical protein
MMEAILSKMAAKSGAETSRESVTANSSGTSKTKLNLDQAGFDKIVQDILGAEQGLASMVQGQGTAGMYGSSTNTLLTQKFVTDIAGELAKLTAEQVTEKEESSKSVGKKSSAKTVICTELERQGLLDTELYEAGHSHFLSLPAQTVRGYRVWANKVVPLMQKSPRLSKALAPVANCRYEHVTGKRKNFLGWITVHVCQPICYLIGFFVPEGNEYGHEASVNY